MELLHEHELECIRFLLNSVGEEITLTYSDIEYSSNSPISYFNVYKAFNFIQEFNERNFLEIKGCGLDFNGYFYDSFLKRYADLIMDNKLGEARKLSAGFGYGGLDSVLTEKATLTEMRSILDALIEQREDQYFQAFGIDLYDNIYIKLLVNPELQTFLDSYLEAFTKDELKLSELPKEDWAIDLYFKKSFYRYKKQREILLDIFKQKLETQSPKDLILSLKNDIDTTHLNLGELILCLEREGVIVSCQEQFGNAEQGIVLNLVLSEKALGILSTGDDAVISVASNLEPELIAEGKTGYFKFYKHGPKIEIGSVKTRKFRLLEVLIEPLGAGKTLDVVFDAISKSKDESDTHLVDPYLSKGRKLEIIQYAMKELQKIDGLRGRIKLSFGMNKRVVNLFLS